MTKTILITGASTGIGKSTAKFFQARGWNVVATMRRPNDETELTGLENVLVTHLDVTDESSVKSAVSAGLERFGKIDALLNNAGYGAWGPLEAFSLDRIRQQFETNVFGLLATMQAVLPHMRAAGAGVIVNVSSIGGKMTFPLGTIYHGTKYAVEGISEAMTYELDRLGIKMKIVEPGVIKTDFAGRSLDFNNDESMLEYQPVVQLAKANMAAAANGGYGSEPELVAEVIWNAVTDGTSTLRYRAGADAVALLDQREAQDDETFLGAMKQNMSL
ncbi:SDR family oxidoreductase [Candidatus Halocynthiibacter alkanivorans]|uniref:SDR family oxidoreductase n=1 Tax=Candidatus Halocynthiibacter alkanivorans TaxID=2267619 RepID=UPI000DF1A934|nr:SDR family oxidoreductase [Candidatus Halocynthiibacter alkanivorans]